jgi:two-component system KDP operon response regulator KdpE
MSPAASILVVDDEPNEVALIQLILGEQGYSCFHAFSGTEGLRVARQNDPSLVILDLGLPDLTGVEVTRTLRKRSWVPILIVSARGLEQDKISALDGGANDYVTKPFAAGEFLARVRAMLRPRALAPGPAGAVTFGDVTVDFETRRIDRGGRPIALTRTEYRLLEVLLAAPGEVLTHRQIIAQVWGPSGPVDASYVRVYMRRLRLKIEEDPVRPRYLLTELGVGYRFRAPP